jgi:N6-L-threonylcarbamoyladenine synthase
MVILGIETSCDETAAAVVKLRAGRMEVLREVIASQAKLHARYGGIVPEVAARKQVEIIIPVLEQVGVLPKQIDAIAVTSGPGLVTSLGVGVETAKCLSLAWGKPLLGVNHVLAHLYACWLSHPQLVHNDALLPTLGLIVSGGHTELVLLRSNGRYKLLGRTLDDAAGECLDKSARLLGLPYPGGAKLEQLAKRGDPSCSPFPKSLANTHSLDFSFSGLKTAVRYHIEKARPTGRQRADIAAGVQAAVAEQLTRRVEQALTKYRVNSMVIGGGVTANQYIRSELQRACNRHDVPLLLPEQRWTGDNAAMIAALALVQLRGKSKTQISRLKNSWRTLIAEPNWEL